MLRIKMKELEGKDVYINIITLNVMTKAIANKTGINEKKAKQIAGFIMDLFGYDDRIIDNVLKPEDRQLLYLLEAEGFLITGREEGKLYDGREWLTHYWELRKNTILTYAKNKIKKAENTLSNSIETDITSNRNIYSTLSDDIWTMRKNSGKKSTHGFRIP